MNCSPIKTSLRRAHSNQGFTLIELLVTIAIILILAGITFGISKGVYNSQARAKAKAELATISQALEAFKLQYGDYPWQDDSAGDYDAGPYSGTESSTMMLYALTGRLKMTRDDRGTLQVERVGASLDNQNVKDSIQFLDPTKFTYSGTDSNPLALLDPWGYPYIYLYKSEGAEVRSPGTWEIFGFHLYSCGPDGEASNAVVKGQMNQTSGVLEDEFRDETTSRGIIFAGE
ncbi:MAG: prepilin-type N-terminal cleavage/methylation domain-containing protein [Opitutaceae bacterium]